MKIAFIGGGNMGEAMLAAVLQKGLAKSPDICVSDISSERRQYLKEKYKIAVTASSRDAISHRDIVVLAVKPQNIDDVFSELKDSLKPNQLILSIVAGIKIATICQKLGHRRVVRVMPNTPAQVGLGMSGWTSTGEVTEEQTEWTQSILGAMGREIYFNDEKYLDMVTAVSASGPAYFFLFAECLAEAAVAIGLPRREAEVMVAQTMLGAANLLEKSGETSAELRRKVTSKGGTTECALQAFEEGKLINLVRQAVRAAYQRAQELGS
jgi:pyrroline-5-carboxylate reductase